jgi:TRAP-type mannitol/chloroaromatic compound transport system permease large subunit
VPELLEIIRNNMAPIMFGSMIVFLLIGYPVAFSLAACGIIFGLVGISLGMLESSLFQAMPDRIWGVMSNETLLAIPFFTFMGLILERSGMAEDLLETIGQLFGPVRGGLAFAVILVGAMLAIRAGSTEPGIPMMVATSILSIFVYPFVYVATVVLYYDIRVRKEGFDLELMAADVPAT